MLLTDNQKDKQTESQPDKQTEIIGSFAIHSCNKHGKKNPK